MARIKIEDLPRDRELTDEELRRVRGGFSLLGASVVLGGSTLVLSLALYTYSLGWTEMSDGQTGGDNALSGPPTPGIGETQLHEQGQTPLL